ncbi:MAG: alpha/beta hydrolase [Gammaproteobacteria bacterium]|nr:alpha/beta hydrolase [Gammaproteobacteria bacterium]
MIKNYTLFLCQLFLIASCATSNLIERNETAEKLAINANFQLINFDTGSFRLHGWGKKGWQKKGWQKKSITKHTQRENIKSLIVYIEGDGTAWENRFKRSNNPTPINPMSLRLATLDERNNILYLARPCQFENSQVMINCNSKYWTSHRYSQEVIDAYSIVLDKISEQYGVNQFEIVGFSGGGVIAMLLAAQRNDVIHVTTIASNLDHFEWSEFHGVTPLSDSLAVYPFISGLTDVSQLHLFGGQDQIVPFKINKNLLNHLLTNDAASYRIIDDFNHLCCWTEGWPDILLNKE